MKLTQTIAFRLFLTLAVVQILILAALTVAAVRVQELQIMQNVVLGGQRVSDVIIRSTRHSMLLNQKEEVHNVVRSLTGQPGIEGLRIYNKQGDIIFSSSPEEIHTTVDLNAEACISCHPQGRFETNRRQTADLSRIIPRPGGGRTLGLITPIPNEPQCSDAACHAHPADKTMLGVLDVKLSLATVDASLADSRRELVFASVAAVLLVALVSWGFIWVVVRRPVRRLLGGMELVTGGNLDHQLPVNSRNELGQLARAFNRMTTELSRARSELTGWSETLEEKVREKTADLERAHAQMVRVEKMASLGGLAATVAHELNNPLEGILTFARLLIKRLQRQSIPDEEKSSMTGDLRLVADEAARCGNIVKNLLVFSRQKGGSFQVIPLHTVVDRCVLLMRHHAEMHGVRLIVEQDPADSLTCDPDQLQQALLALMVNAIEAMSTTGGASQAGGTLTLTSVRSSVREEIHLSVADTGIGMTDDVKARIFEPFFTTKSEGKGVGLGLSVVYGIIQAHHGSIDVHSAPGKGTTFILTLPLTRPVPQSGGVARTAPEGTPT